MRLAPPQAKSPVERSRAWAIAEVALIVVLFFLAAGTPPPAVNEAHYLTKAKHYWDPSWAPGDLFLESADAHLVFYWTFGWLTLWLPLPAVAWTGRFITWILLAWSWRRLSICLIPRPLASVLSAALLIVLTSRLHMAGEWIIGGVEAKGFSYVLVLVALAELTRGRFVAVWLLLGAATAFHVLVGGWSLVAAAMVWLALKDRPPLRTMLPGLLGAALLALPGLLPALALTWSSPKEHVGSANLIYVFYRLDHHLMFQRFPLVNILRHGALLAVWLSLWAMLYRDPPWRRLGWFVAAAVLLALVGIAIDQVLIWRPQTAAALLRYYWFRLSDVMIPAGVALALPALIDRRWAGYPKTAHCLLVATMLVPLIHLSYPILDPTHLAIPDADKRSFVPRTRNQEQLWKLYGQWRGVTEWIAQHTEPDAQFLTPRYQQTFKWYAGRAEVYSSKDIPQDARGVVEWWKRERRIFPRPRDALGAHSDEALLELARYYEADYILVDRTRTRRPLGFPRIYPNLSHPDVLFEVYRVPDGPAAPDQQ